jgi:precorrin-2 dehydrogenase/sirohydrochlorin ferrochelatase
MNTRNSMNQNYYPAFINLYEKQCVVVGGGSVAERKVLPLLRSGAKITVISPALTEILEKQRDKGAINHIKRNYKRGDLKGAFLVIAATSDERINREVSEDAPCLVNAVDMPEIANFIVPSTINSGQLTIAVSTSGASPAVARAIRKELELLYGRDFGQYINFLKKLRERAKKEILDKDVRKRFLKELASKEIIQILRKNGFKMAKERVIEQFNLLKKGAVTF